MALIYFKAAHSVEYRHLPGMEALYGQLLLYGWAVPVDRTGILTLPIRIKSLFPLPELRNFSLTYQELCDTRAHQLLERATTLDVPIYVFWSGGIDSTCLLVSLLKAANKSQRERITVLLSEESINEYPLYYQKYIRGKLRRESAERWFPYVYGAKALLINGEHNDQLFGSDVLGPAMRRFGEDLVKDKYDPNLFITLFTEKLKGNRPVAVTLTKAFERLCDGAPIPLPTNYDRLWWVNFATKWQGVYLRPISYKQSAASLSAKWVRDYYAPFYNTEEFQLWSMSTVEQRRVETWQTYKGSAREIIYNFTKDESYRDRKLKRGSLQYLVDQHPGHNIIDDKFQFRDSAKPEEFYAAKNDYLPVDGRPESVPAKEQKQEKQKYIPADMRPVGARPRLPQPQYNPKQH